MRRLMWALPLWLAASLAFGQTTTTEVVEFYHEGLDHYFITAEPVEIGYLDTGVVKGWARTGQKFVAGSPSSQLPGAEGICRFYGKPERGLDSHFYPATLAECVATREKYHPDTWLFESDNVFKLYLPDQNTGVCPATTTPVYRAWNNRPDVNHRYTTDRSLHLSMVAKGYKEEGFGGNGKPVVAMCALSASNPVAAGVPVPECTIAADNTFPRVGGSVTLTASCSNNPTKYVWSDALCASAGSSCRLTGAEVGYKNYTVKGGNAGGDGMAVGVLVQWQASTVLPPPSTTPTAPSCTIIANTSTPVIETELVLSASCTGSPTSYTWVGCPAPAGRSCRTIETVEGRKSYTVTATNTAGTSSPTTMTASWVRVAPPVGVNCTLFADPVSPVVGTPLRLTASCTGNPTTFVWSAPVCTGNSPTCTPTPQGRPGADEYVLTASNASGSHTATVRVLWQDPPLPPAPAPTGCQIVRFPTTFTTSLKFGRMIGLLMRTEEMAVEFTTPNYTSTVRGQLNSFEYFGAPQYKTGAISNKPCDFSFGAGKTNLDGPAGTNNNYFFLGKDHPKYVTLEPNQTYYYNLKSFGWTPETAEQQFAVEIYMP